MKNNTLISIVTLIFISIFFINISVAEGKRTNKYGIIIINGEAAYIDVSKLDQTVMVVSKNSIDQNKEIDNTIISAGRLLFEKKNFIITIDTKTDSPYQPIWKSMKEYLFKVKNDKMFVSKDNVIWDELKIRIVDEPKNTQKGRLIVPVYLIIHLNCKWFHGEYEVIGTTG